MGLVFFNGLLPSCYVGGAGGIAYLMEAEHVAKGLGIPFPQAVVWRPHDRYLGVGQMEALLELKRICGYLHVRDLSEARNVLETHVSEIQGRLDELEVLKSGVAKRLRKLPSDEKLKQEMREASMRKKDFLKSSNLSVFCHELKVLENISVTLDLTASVIDYCVNVGLKETSAQWVRFLNENGNLHSEVKLESALDQDVIRERICG
jgi:hypothetical protein